MPFRFVFIGLYCTIRRSVDRLSVDFVLSSCCCCCCWYCFDIHLAAFAAHLFRYIPFHLVQFVCFECRWSSIKIKMYVANFGKEERYQRKVERKRTWQEIHTNTHTHDRKTHLYAHYYRYLTIKWLSLAHERTIISVLLVRVFSGNANWPLFVVFSLALRFSFFFLLFTSLYVVLLVLLLLLLLLLLSSSSSFTSSSSSSCWAQKKTCLL